MNKIKKQFRVIIERDEDDKNPRRADFYGFLRRAALLMFLWFSPEGCPPDVFIFFRLR